MRSHMTRAVVLVAAMTLGAGATASAEVTDLVKVNIPFPFLANGKHLPAGSYLIQRDDTSAPAILIRGENGNLASTFVVTIPVAGRNPKGSDPSLTFTRVENQLHLATVWESGTEGVSVVDR